jgi:hypothetical protein
MRTNVFLLLVIACLLLAYHDRSVPIPVGVLPSLPNLSPRAKRDILSVLENLNF